MQFTLPGLHAYHVTPLTIVAASVVLVALAGLFGRWFVKRLGIDRDN